MTPAPLRAERDSLARLFSKPETTIELGPLIDAGVGWAKLAEILPAVYPSLFAGRMAPDPERVREAWQALSPFERDWGRVFVDEEVDSAQERMLADDALAS